jgi:hypothetical protein
MPRHIKRRGRHAVHFAIEPLEQRQLLARTPIVLPYSALERFFAPTSLSAAPLVAQSITTQSIAAGGNTVVNQVPGALTNHVIYTQGGHGYTYMFDSTTNKFIYETQRPFINSMVEDAGNQDQMTYFVDYALKAGATVVPVRGVGHQDSMVIVDNSDAGFSVIQGTFNNDTTDTPYWSDNGGNDAVHYASATGTGNPNATTALAQFTPNLPSTGFYPVYTWYANGPNQSTSAAFTINYAGGSFTIHINQRLTGKGWVYLGTYYFNAGTSGNVQVSNASSSTGAVIADAVRFGNGRALAYDTTGAAVRYGSTNTFAANATVGSNTISIEDLAGLYWAYASRGWTGANTRVPTTAVDAGSTSDDNTRDFGAPDRWAAYMNNYDVTNAGTVTNTFSGVMTDRVWLSFHSNASGTGSGSRGDYGLINSVPTPNQSAYALTMGQTVSQDMTAQNSRWQYPWGIQPYTFSGAYSEISNNVIHGLFDATIVEVAYHDNTMDAALLEDPKVRDAAAKSSVHGIISYFHTFGGLANTTKLPDPPTDVRATTDSGGNVTISWTPGPSGNPYGDAATGYRVYTSTNGYGFGNGYAAAGTSLTISGLPANSVTYFQVTATNAGGESWASPVVAAKPQLFRRAPILIVNNYNRLDLSNDFRQTSGNFQGNNAAQTYDRVLERFNNTQDYGVQAASAISTFNANLGIESCTDAAIANGEINLGDYQTVIWMSGEQSSANGTFTSTVQPLVTAYLNAGGKMFVNGSEIGFDLVAAGHGASFYLNSLHTNYVANSAATYSTSAGVAGKALASVPALSFDDGTHGTYNVDFPDIISAGAGASVAMNYNGGSGGAAAIQYTSGNTQIINMGFPFESIYTVSQRNSLMAAVLGFFNTASTLITAAPGAPTLLPASDTGVSNNDNDTSKNNSAGAPLQFTVNGVTSGAAVTLFANGTTIATGAATTSSIILTTNGTVTLPDGASSITAREQFSGFGQSPDSAALPLMIDTTPPTASIVAIAPSPRDASVSSIGVNFSESIAGFDRADVSLTRDGGANLLTASQSVTGSGAAYSVNNLDSLTTPTGLYHLSVTASGSGITDIAGNALVANASTDFAVAVITGNTTAANTFRLTNGSAGKIAIFLNNATQTPDFQWTIASGQRLIINGGSGNDTLIVQGTLPAPIIFHGGAGADSLDVQGGTFTLAGDADAGTANLSISAETGGNVVFNSSQHLAALNLAGGSATLGSGGNKVLVTSALSISNGGQLDLADNDMIVNYGATSPQATILPYLSSGFNNGNWNGAGIFSSSAATDALHRTAISYAENSTLGDSTFDGEPVTAKSILLKYTYYGDNNLDGKIDIGNDFSLFIDGLSAHGSTWLQGDYTYDGKVDLGNDFNLFLIALHNQGSVL